MCVFNTVLNSDALCMQRKTISFLITPSFGFRAIMMSTFLTYSPPSHSTQGLHCLTHMHSNPSQIPAPPDSQPLFSVFTSGSWVTCYSISFLSLLPSSKMQACPNSSCSSLLTTLPFLRNLQYVFLNISFKL